MNDSWVMQRQSFISFTFGRDASRHQLPQHERTGVNINFQEVLNAEVDGTVKNFRSHVSSCANLQ